MSYLTNSSTILIINSPYTKGQYFVDIQYDLSMCDENTLKLIFARKFAQFIFISNYTIL